VKGQLRRRPPVTARPSTNATVAAITDDAINAAKDRVLQMYSDLGPTDQTAKGPELVERVKADLLARFPTPNMIPASN
jgi:hypothetical protein